MISALSTSGALFFFCFLLAWLSPVSGSEPAAGASRRPGLWEFALRKINPAEIDYGAELERRRQTLLHELRDPRLWAEATGLGMILSGWVLLARHRGEKLRREIVTAELLAQYHNALAEARVRLEQAIADNRALRDAAQSAITSSSPDRSPVISPLDPAQIYLESNFPSRPSRRPAARTAESPQTSTRVEELEKQLGESREREKLLQKELERFPALQPSSRLPKAPARSPRDKTPI